MMSNWNYDETEILIRKRLEMFGCSKNDKIYEQISLYLAQKHNTYRNAAACATRFNNMLKTYRHCVKRLENGGQLNKKRFPYFDTFHQYYGPLNNKNGESAEKCKSELFIDDNESSFADGSAIDSMMMDSTQADEEPTSFPEPEQIPQLAAGDADMSTINSFETVKLRLMEQKLLYYTNQNMLLQIKQEHYRLKEQDRARSQLMTEEILKVLKGIYSCMRQNTVRKTDEDRLPATGEMKDLAADVVTLKETFRDEPAEEEECEEEEEPEHGAAVSTICVDTEEEVEEEEEENGVMDVQSSSGGSSMDVTKSPEVGRLKVRKNIFPPWNRIQTVLLIKIHCDLRPKFQGYNLFECVSNKLIELHINRTPRDCRIRWNNLFRTYKDCRMRLKTNQQACVKFEYFEDIDAYFKDKEVLSQC